MMRASRYKNEYKPGHTTDRKGRRRPALLYTGEEWVFVSGREKAKNSGRTVAAFVAAGWVFFLGALAVNSAAMRTIFVSLPFAFSGLALGLLTRCCFDLLWMEEVIQHVHADRLNNGFPAEAFFLMFLAGCSLVGEAAVLIQGKGMIPGDIIFTVCAALLLLAGKAVFDRRGEIRLEVKKEE